MVLESPADKIHLLIAKHLRENNSKHLETALGLSKQEISDLAGRLERGEIQFHPLEGYNDLAVKAEGLDERLGSVVKVSNPATGVNWEVLVGDNKMAHLQFKDNLFTILGRSQEYSRPSFVTLSKGGSFTSGISDREPGQGIDYVSRAHAIVVVQREPGTTKETVLVGHLGKNPTEIQPHEMGKPRRLLR